MVRSKALDRERRKAMEVPKIFESEYRFCLILWANEPINSTQLVKLCKEQLGWSKTTTYTVIHRLSERGVLKNENATVSSLVSKEQVQEFELDQLVEKTFEGSIPSFIAAFSRSKKLSQEEIDQLQALIDEHRKGV
jgi:predicted transcriptional regulator